MKHINLQTTITLLLLSMLPLLASGFRVNGICYYINSDGTSVTVTYERTSSPRYNNLSGSLTIPESVTYNGTTYSVTGIGYRAFESCSGLTSVTIGNSVTYISDNAFRYCSGLTSVTIPNSVTSIGYDAFSDCSGLTSVTIGNSVTSIGDNAFRYCYGLTSVTIGNSVTSIGDDAFWDCSGISELTWNAKNCSSRGSMPTSKIETLTIGNEVESLPSSLVSGSKITSVTIPNSVTSIGSSAFSGCYGLTSVTIPNSVTSIGYSAFARCSGLKQVVWNAKNCGDFFWNDHPFDSSMDCSITNFIFGDSVQRIPSSLCYEMTKLTSIAIPNSVTSIGREAFWGCSGLTEVVWNAKNCSDFTSSSNPFSSARQSITYFTFGDSVQKIPAYICYHFTALTSVTIPNSVTSIGYEAFSGCSGLTSVTIGNSVTSIGGGAFDGCSGLTEVTIPNSVTSIGSSAFSGCSGLTKLTSQIVEPQEVFYGSSVFYGVSSSCRVYVPRFTYYQYKKTFPWSRFFIVSDEANLQLNVEMDTLRHTRGEEAQIMDVTLDLSNYVDLTGLQFDVTLPSEITYSNAILENGRSGGDHTIDVARIQFGKYRVLLSSLTNQPINGEDGPLLHFAVTVPRLHGTGYRSISFDNIVLATTDEIAYNIFGFTTGLKLDYIVGDANADALVDAADYVVTARRIMGYSTATYYSDAANVNNDGSVNVTDLVGITNIALGIRPIERRQLPALMPNEQSAVHTAPALSATVQAQPDGNQVLFALGNEWAAAGMQMDVTLPAGVTVLKAELLGRAAGQQVDLATLADGRVRVLVSSFSASDIAAGDDAILALTLDGSQNGMMTVSDIIVAERDLTTHELAPLSVALSTTGVSDLVASAGVRIWAENGSVVIESDEAGMAQLVMLNGMTQPLQVQPGRNTYPVAPGYYIVRLAGHTAKLKL
ncbi:MAG: leucine-rich repeat protein [Muribaculaceae bacterium]|nr:leucine-rich repeat protein [Muribaculaceae bacterium]